MRFGELLKHSRPDLVVSARHDEWLHNNSNPEYNSDALRFAQEQLYLQSTPRDRKGTVSASSLDSCRRRQEFTYLGMPEVQPQPRTAAIFQTGTFTHLRWQMAGITEGWLEGAELPVPQPNPLRLHGTMDGVLDDGSVVEFKSINTYGFREVLAYGPKPGHITQVGSYMWLDGRGESSIIYENKDTQDYKEIRIPLTQELSQQVEDSSKEIWGLIDGEMLAEPLNECEERRGRFNYCPFKDVCLKTVNWKHAHQVAEES